VNFGGVDLIVSPCPPPPEYEGHIHSFHDNEAA